MHRTRRSHTPRNRFGGIDSTIEAINSELVQIQKDYSRIFEEHRKELDALKADNAYLRQEITSLQKSSDEHTQMIDEHANMINQQERFSRRNNIGIVGLKSHKDEDCIKLATDVFAKAEITNCRIESAQRDDRHVQGRQRHLLVKVFLPRQNSYSPKCWTITTIRELLYN